MLIKLLQFILILAIGLGSVNANAADIVVCYEDSISDYKVAMQEFVDNLEEKYQKNCDYVGYSQLENDPGILKRINSGICVVIGSRPAKIARENLPAGIPIAYCMVYSPDGLELLDDEINFGITLKVDPQKQIAFIKEILPGFSKLSTFIHFESDLEGYDDLKLFKDSGLDLDLVEIPDDVKNSDRPDYVNKILKGNPDVIWTYPDSNTFNMVTIKLVLLGGIKNQVPVFGYSEKVVKAGALFGVAVVPETQGEGLAAMVNTFLNGDQLAVSHRYAVFEPAFNLSVAEKLNISIPQEMLDGTNYVYGDKEKYRKKVGR